jgi:redox-sensing transcriptional repressor
MSHVPQTTVFRLPAYLRCLDQARAEGAVVINSADIADLSGTNAAQVRKDLSYLGDLGTRGIGYDVEALAEHITGVLGLTARRRIAIVGYGRLGGALASYVGSGEHGFDVVAIVDTDPAKVGTSFGDVAIRAFEDLEDAMLDARVEIAVITTPADSAREVAARVAAAGIRAILNFAPASLDVAEGVTVRNVDLSAELQILSYYLTNGG